MPELRSWGYSAAVRVLRCGGATAVSLLSTGTVVNLYDLDWRMFTEVVLGSMLCSLCMSLAGLPEVVKEEADIPR